MMETEREELNIRAGEAETIRQMRNEAPSRKADELAALRDLGILDELRDLCQWAYARNLLAKLEGE